MSKKSFTVAILIGTSFPLALAAPVSALTFVGGTSFWSNPVGTTTALGFVVYENQTGPPLGGPYLNPQPITLSPPNNVNPSGIRWGNPTNVAGTNPNLFKSGLRAFGSSFSPPLFIPTTGASVTASSIFVLDHINYPIFSALTQVTWNLRLEFRDDSNNQFFVDTAIPVAINETVNQAPCAFSTTSPPVPNPPCPDRITLTQPNIAIVAIPGTTEFINLQLQFPTTGTNSLITNENQQNLFPINGIFTRAPAPAPLGALGIFSILAGSYKALKRRYSTIISRQN